MVAQGNIDSEIAAALSVSRHTVRTQITDICDKLGVNNRKHLVAALGMTCEATGAKMVSLLDQIADLTAERNGYRMENRELRERVRRQ